MKNLYLLFIVYLITQTAYSQTAEQRFFSKSLSVNVNTPVELTDDSGQSLNINNIYRVHLVTRNTGTDTGAEYLVWYDNNSSIWRHRAVNIRANISNSPILFIDNNIVKIKTNHANLYTVKAFVEELNTQEADVEPHIFGSSYQWQRERNSLFYKDGNVGIGTTAPDTKLHLEESNVGIKTTYATQIIEANDAQLDLISSSAGNWGSAINLVEGNGDANNDIWSIVRRTSNDNSSLRINYGTSNNHENPSLITFNTNGNVGIGTNSPTAKLDIGKSNLENAFSVGSSNDGGRIYTSYESGKGTLNFVEHDDPFVLSFTQAGTNTNEKIIFDQGNFGIGTTTMGSHKLAVEGSIGAREIKVEANGWSDFVFENTYQLPSLKEVENHIQQKGHLKDIPSAKEVEENGIFLGQMDAKLLQKIEELTLYTIQQQKEIKYLSKKLNELEQKLDKVEKSN